MIVAIHITCDPLLTDEQLLLISAYSLLHYQQVMRRVANQIRLFNMTLVIAE